MYHKLSIMYHYFFIGTIMYNYNSPSTSWNDKIYINYIIISFFIMEKNIVAQCPRLHLGMIKIYNRIFFYKVKFVKKNVSNLLKRINDDQWNILVSYIMGNVWNWSFVEPTIPYTNIWSIKTKLYIGFQSIILKCLISS
jgi:hypothetical protein